MSRAYADQVVISHIITQLTMWNESTLCGTSTSRAALKNPTERREKQVSKQKLPVRTNFQEIGLTFCETQQINRNFLNLFRSRLPLPLWTTIKGKSYYVRCHNSVCRNWSFHGTMWPRGRGHQATDPFKGRVSKWLHHLPSSHCWHCCDSHHPWQVPAPNDSVLRHQHMGCIWHMQESHILSHQCHPQ